MPNPVFKSSLGEFADTSKIDGLSGPDLVILHNELAAAVPGAEATKRFADRGRGVVRTSRLFNDWRTRQEEEAAKGEEAPVEPKKSSRKATDAAGTGKRLVLEAKALTRPYKRSTNRGKVIDLCQKPDGASVAELTKATGWDRPQILACLRQVNQYNGLGVEETEEGRFCIEGGARHRKRMSWPAKGEVRPHRSGTKRAKALELLLRPEGAAFEEVRDANGWTDAQAYEGIKLLHGYLGYGITESEDGKITAFSKTPK